MRAKLTSWWTRPCGPHSVLAMALPLMISTLSWTVMSFVDRMFLLWYSTDAMAAALPAGVLQFAVLCPLLGVASYVNAFVAQYDGADRPRRIGPIVWQGIWIGIFATPLLLVTIPMAPRLFAWAGHPSEIASLETIYYQLLTLSSGALVIAAAQSSFFTGRGATRVVMLVDCSAVVLNALLAYLWIFGHWGFPAGGIAGAALATTVAEWARVAMYGWILMRPEYEDEFGMSSGWRLDGRLMRRLIRLGGPGGVQLFMEVAAFTAFVVLVGRLGPEAMAATNLAFNVNTMAWMPVVGLGTAVTAMVGQELGRNEPRLAARATWSALGLAMLYMGTMALLYLFVPDVFLFGHAAGARPEEFAPLRETTIVLLRFVAVYCLFDAMNLVFSSAIKGAGDMGFVFLTTLLTAPPLALGTWWGIAWKGWGLLWCWTVVTLWVCSLGLMYLGRFLFGRWRDAGHRVGMHFQRRRLGPAASPDGPGQRRRVLRRKRSQGCLCWGVPSTLHSRECQRSPTAPAFWGAVIPCGQDRQGSRAMGGPDSLPIAHGEAARGVFLGAVSLLCLRHPDRRAIGATHRAQQSVTVPAFCTT